MGGSDSCGYGIALWHGATIITGRSRDDAGQVIDRGACTPHAGPCHSADRPFYEGAFPLTDVFGLWPDFMVSGVDCRGKGADRESIQNNSGVKLSYER